MYKTAIVPDTHTGSVKAVFPYGFKTFTGNDISKAMSMGQRILHKYWDNFIEICKQEQIDEVWFIGDQINGINRNAFGQGQLITDIDEQTRAFVKLTLPLVQIPSVKIVRITTGSPYHESIDVNICKQIAEMFRNYGVNAIYEGQFIDTKIENITIYAQHEISPALRLGTTLEKQIEEMQLARASGRSNKYYDIDIRAHLHFYRYLEEANTRALLVPCWQCYTHINGMSKSPHRWQPDIGAVILKIDNKDIYVKRITYPPIDEKYFR